jgi:hypothetical protein
MSNVATDESHRVIRGQDDVIPFANDEKLLQVGDVFGGLRLAHAGDYIAHSVVQLPEVRDVDRPVSQELPDKPAEPELLPLI